MEENERKWEVEKKMDKCQKEKEDDLVTEGEEVVDEDEME